LFWGIIKPMRRFETPYIADWFATTVRWIVLVGLIVSLSLRGQLNAVPLGLLAIMFIWNIAMSVMAGLSLRLLTYHRQIVLGVDFLLAAIFFLLKGELAGTSIWVGILPVLLGAVYFEMWGAFIAGGVFALLQYLVSRDSFSNDFALIASSGLVLTLLIGLIAGVLGRLGMGRLRVARQTRLDAEERLRRMESERLRAIYELTSTMTATLSYRRVWIRLLTWDIQP